MFLQNKVLRQSAFASKQDAVWIKQNKAPRQSAFAITACGPECTLRALPLEVPTADMAAKMALQVRRAGFTAGACTLSRPRWRARACGENL